MTQDREARRIDGASLAVNLRHNVLIASPGGVARVGGLVAELIEVLLRRHPNTASYQRLRRELYPSAIDCPADGPNAIRTIVKRSRKALRPLGFDIETVRPVHADCPSAYRLVRFQTQERAV